MTVKRVRYLDWVPIISEEDKHDWKPYASTELSAYQWCLHCLKVRLKPREEPT
jgi:hypothetical protein